MDVSLSKRFHFLGIPESIFQVRHGEYRQTKPHHSICIYIYSPTHASPSTIIILIIVDGGGDGVKHIYFFLLTSLNDEKLTCLPKSDEARR